MGLIQCDAFIYHGCMKKKVKSQLICCHSCPSYDDCQKRCENKPNFCGKSKAVKEDMYNPVNGALKPNENRVAQYDPYTGELIAVFVSLKEAANSIDDGSSYNARIASISNCARGIQNTAKGYVWKYL